MEDDYDSYYGIAVKIWCGARGTEKNGRYVIVCGCHYGRWIIERDGLISFQVMCFGITCSDVQQLNAMG